MLLGLGDYKDAPGTGGSGGATTSSTSSTATSSSTSSSATSSSGGPCTPGTMADCYTGPPGTEKVGNCRDGKKACGQDGTYGACLGEVKPMPEVCATVGDEDCDGIACSDTLWAFNAGDANDQYLTKLAVDAAGNVVATGYFQGTITFLNKAKGTSVVLNANGIGAFVAKLTSAGDVLWGGAFSTGNNVYPSGLAVDPKTGDVIVVGAYSGKLAFPRSPPSPRQATSRAPSSPSSTAGPERPFGRRASTRARGACWEKTPLSRRMAMLSSAESTRATLTSVVSRSRRRSNKTSGSHD